MAVICSFVAYAIAGAVTSQATFTCSPRKKLTCTAECMVRMATPLSASTTSDLSKKVLPPLEVSTHATEDGPAEPLVSSILAVTMYVPTGTETLATCVNVGPIRMGCDGIRASCGLNATETPGGPCAPVDPA